ncbi:MAG: aminoglycoside phosphotransferase family protein [Treponema sp.]|nr:aminoglycoside phosphotransferase family protein [Treponema sp.]
MSNAMLQEAIPQFAIYGDFVNAAPFGNGHINETFLSVWNQAGVRARYVHQRINELVFTKPDEVMENIVRVTEHLAGKMLGRADSSRRALSVVPARDGKPWARDSAGGWWRTYLYIEGSHSKDTIDGPESARFLGECAGLFQKQLADLPAPRLRDTIPRFHDMEMRYENFRRALESDPRSRAAGAEAEIAFMRENEERGALIVRALREGKIPERICHNDVKINNILLDNETAQALCVVDLDTVMPGASLYDLGDLIRTVANRAAEDERALEKVVFDMGFFEALLDGYFSAAGDFLTQAELDLAAESGRNLTHIMALRFLTDYLDGDVYYKISRPVHNLERCRAQIALIRSMDERWEEAENIARRLAGRNA